MPKENQPKYVSSIEKTSTGDRARDIYNRFGIFIILATMILIMVILTPNFLTYKNITNVIRQISFIAIIGFGATFVIITGGIDLSAGSVVGVVSVITASFAHPGEYPLIVPILIGVAVGLVFGLINGLLIARLSVPPFIATLGTMTSGRGFAMLFSSGRPVNDLSAEYNFLGAGELFGIPFPIILLLAIAVIMYIVLDHTRFGRHVLAVGGNEQAAKISGIGISRVKVMVYSLAGALAAFAGILMTSRISSGQPNLGIGYEMDAVAASVIGGVSLKGGVGTIWGTLCGALVIGIINNGMDLMGVNAYWQQIVKGLIIVLAVILDQLKTRRS
ncbi:MAG: ABC transporter permease [Christensenellales bacterium]|jgi:inositol transport system permease protein